MTENSITLERTGYADTRRLVQGGEIIALVQRFANGKWGAYDASDRQITPESFDNPRAVLKWFKSRA